MPLNAASAGDHRTNPNEHPKNGFGQSLIQKLERIPLRMLAGRLVAIPVSVFAVVSLAFWLVRLSGSNAAAEIAGAYADAEAIAKIEHQLGLDQSLVAQYVSFMKGLLQGDLGVSYFTHQPVSHEIFARLPLDLTIGVLSLLVAVVVGVGMGTLGGYYRGQAVDGLVRLIVSVLQSLPDYVFALLLIYGFFYLLGVAPAPIGQLPMRMSAPDGPSGVALLDGLMQGNAEVVWAALRQLALPVFSYGLVLSAVFARVTRMSISQTLASGQVQYARACGLTPWRIFCSVLVTTRTAILTCVAVVTGAIIGGGAILQKIYNLDGAAAFGVDSIFKFDMPVIQGVVIIFASLSIVAYLLIDIVILLLDPRVGQKS
jgi:peptide/nickel transport system permease protein